MYINVFNIAYSKSYTHTYTHPHRIDSILLALLIFIKHEFFNISTVANVDVFLFLGIIFVRGCYRKQQEKRKLLKKSEIKC